MFDFAAFLADHWKDSDALHAFLLKHGVRDFEKQAIYKWWIRASIPAQGFAVVLAVLEVSEGAPVSIVKWLRS